MNFNQLLYRLTPNQLDLIKCKYRANGWGDKSIFMTIKNNLTYNNENLDFRDRFLLRANPNTGKIEVDFFIKTITDKKDITLDELLLIFQKNQDNKWNYRKLKETVYNHNIVLTKI